MHAAGSPYLQTPNALIENSAGITEKKKKICV